MQSSWIDDKTKIGVGPICISKYKRRRRRKTDKTGMIGHILVQIKRANHRVARIHIGDFIDEESAYEELVEELVFESLEDDLDPQDANLQIATKSSEKQEQRLASENLVSDGNGQIFPNNLTQSREKNFNLPLDHPGLFGSMEFLWWQLNETSLDYTVHQTSPVTSLQSSKALTLGHVHTVDIDWNPGFRLGLGYRFAKDNWQLGGVYTYYYTKANDQVDCPTCSLDNPTITSWLSMTLASNIGVLKEASANLHFWYHIGDVELAKSVLLGKNTICRFIVGPSMGFIQQKFHTLSVDNTNTVSACQTQYTQTRMDWNFSGGGIKIGMDSNWNVFNRFSFLFGGHLTALYGFYVNKWHADKFTTVSSDTCISSPVLEKFGDWTIKDRRNIFGTRIFGGIAYNYPFKRLNVALYINYELNTWFNLTDQYRIPGQPLTNDDVRNISTAPLNLSGVDFGLKLSF